MKFHLGSKLIFYAYPSLQLKRMVNFEKQMTLASAPLNESKNGQTDDVGSRISILLIVLFRYCYFIISVKLSVCIANQGIVCFS